MCSATTLPVLFRRGRPPFLLCLQVLAGAAELLEPLLLWQFSQCQVPGTVFLLLLEGLKFLFQALDGLSHLGLLGFGNFRALDIKGWSSCFSPY